MGNEKILVVDDDVVVLESCKRVIESEGYGVILVPSAKRALEILEQERFQLLLIDIKMPERDGMWLIQEIKKRLPEVPIIAMSGFPVAETIADGLKLGARFIAKPFTPDELLDSVREALRKGQGHEGDQSSGH